MEHAWEKVTWEKRRKEIISFLIKNRYLSSNFDMDAKGSNCTVTKNFKLDNVNGRKLKIACILDEFSYESYAPECILFQLTPQNWEQEIENFKPDLFFFESAWQGKDGLWFHKVDRYSDELYQLTAYLRQKGIPIVFWNKEDPVYTDIFMLAASYADFVFTTDIDCITAYKTELKHDRVYHLHFAAQPQIHNPIEKFERKDKFCFAGAYYHKYKERSQIFDSFCGAFIQDKGLDIYDRNFGHALPEHAFPKNYEPYILGNLKSSEIDIAYKSYNYGINMNSIQQSQTMFARRVFELLASNTAVVSNYSRGLKNYFGDLTICTDDVKTLKAELNEYCGNVEKYKKYRLLGLRKVLSEHLYEDRLDYITQKVFGLNIKKAAPQITVVAKVKNAEDATRVLKMFEKQTYKNARLLLIGNVAVKETDKISCMALEQAAKTGADALNNCSFITCFDAGDWYGPNYLTDLALTSRYGDFDGIGKAAFFAHEEAGILLKNANAAYRLSGELQLKKAIIAPALLKNYTLTQLGSVTVAARNLFAADEFNYCENFDGEYCSPAADVQVYDTGIPLAKINSAAEQIKAEEEVECLRIKTDILAGFIKCHKNGFTFSVENNALNIESCLQAGVHEYVYLMGHKIKVAPWLHQGKLPVHFCGHGKLDLICVLICFDKNGSKLTALYPKLNRNVMLQLPPNTDYVCLGLRLKGSGTAKLAQVIFGKTTIDKDSKNYLLRSQTLILTNHYPQPDNLYRNMFVHKRLAVYKASGVVTDVLRMNLYVNDGFYEFEGINVINAQGNALFNILESGAVKTVCVHFLDAAMWSILKPFAKNKQIRLLIWCHGAEIQPWWRRTYNYNDAAELEKAKEVSAKRMELWKDVFALAQNNSNIHFVFVSKYFADEVMEDNKIELKSSSYSIIHNLIDTENFAYMRKPEELRKKILTIKSFSSKTYANDLTAKGICELAKRPCFKDLEFEIYGNGDRFDIDNAPLKKFANVHLHQQFLTQKEIAEAHSKAGVFIATTRMDTQGVSRGEAMSSGLVPIAHNCAAIPEFVDANSGILIPAESYVELADAIETLYNNPALFTKLSKGAAQRVRSQTSKKYTIDKEIKLICGE